MFTRRAHDRRHLDAPTAADPLTLDADGQPILLQPGRTWVELAANAERTPPTLVPASADLASR